MEINGPLKVGVVEPSPDGNCVLHISFSDAFKAADLAAQTAAPRGAACWPCSTPAAATTGWSSAIAAHSPA
ncbi:MAG: hypothetical protein QNJ91_00465 [Gammaproteobacteria bacterium]|nr:hypothetical protein [Gammaproteobacteria bacterium]